VRLSKPGRALAEAWVSENCGGVSAGRVLSAAAGAGAAAVASLQRSSSAGLSPVLPVAVTQRGEE